MTDNNVYACAECGHLHFLGSELGYESCPIEGCECEGQWSSWAPEVFVEGKWSGNGLRFATKDECDRYGRALLARWFVPTDSRSVESDQPVNYELDAAGNVTRVEEVTA